MASETDVLHMKRIFKQSIKDKLITCATIYVDLHLTYLIFIIFIITIIAI